MRCRCCGAEIGEQKVCPFCSTPIKNVLVSDNIDNNSNIEFFGPDSDLSDEYTTVMTSESLDTSILSDNCSESVIENSEIEFSENSKKVVSVIPDSLSSTKNKMSRKKKTLISLLITLGLIIIGTSILLFVIYKQYKNYLDSCTEIILKFTTDNATSTDAMWYLANGELQEINEDNIDWTTEEKTSNFDKFVISTDSNYAAYEISDSYQIQEEDYTSASGWKWITVNTYDLYLETKEKEKIKVYHEEKKEGTIELLGVTDTGVIIYNDTEAGKSFSVSVNLVSSELAGLLKKALMYGDGRKVLLQEDGQLLTATAGDAESNTIVSSNVSDFSYIEAENQYGYLKNGKGAICSTESTSSKIAYTNMDGQNYVKNINSNIADSKKAPFSDMSLVENKIIDENCAEVDVTNVDLSGQGELMQKEKGLYFYCGWYHRNLGKVDEVLTLAGKYAYVIKNGKTVQIDVFSKTETILSDQKLKIVLD